MAQYKGAASEAGRAMQLMKKREREREQLEQLKQKIAEASEALFYLAPLRCKKTQLFNSVFFEPFLNQDFILKFTYIQWVIK